MVARRTVDLLPEIFRTGTNKQFLAATLDQLTQEPSIIKTQGYVGRRVGPGVDPADNYVVESTPARTDYQLEPGVVFFRPETTDVRDAITYPGMIDALALQGANTQRQDRLFQSQYYTWDSFCDLDKFVNYSQYYWLPQGPDSVDIGTTEVPLTDDWDVTRTEIGYQFSETAGNNPTLTLVRGGSYTWQVNQPGSRFWIQAAPGISGTLPGTPNISSRDVLGVTNNGEDQGIITFDVPQKDAQDFFYSLNDIGTVDLLTRTLKFNQINNIYLDQFLAANPDGIDGIVNLEGRTIVFTETQQDAQDGGWQITTEFDPLPQGAGFNAQIGSYDTTTFDETADIPPELRYTIWRINYVPDTGGRIQLQLTSIAPVPVLSKFRIIFGTQYSSTQWYKNASGFFQQIPLLTAVLDDLWYQDSENPELFGRLKLIDPISIQPLDVNEIIGAKNYTSPNGVIFTNGLKVQLRGVILPEQYQNQEFYVEGVGTGPGIDARVGFVDGEAYFGAFHTYQGRRMTGAVHQEDVFQQYIYDNVYESIVNRGTGGPEGAPLPTQPVDEYLVGNGIKLIPVSELITPETYTRSETLPYDSTAYDDGNFDANLNAPTVVDYITQNRSSRDRNAWSRSNRWFHVDVINYTAELNNQVAVLDNDRRGKRPIIEFRADLHLFNNGTSAIDPVNIIDFFETDAFSDINGSLGYSVDGYILQDGSRIIFAADRDPDVRNRVYQVEFIDPDGLPGSPKIINLTPVYDRDTEIDTTVVCLSGNTQQGKTYWFDGSDWVLAQQKTSVNQPILFDIFDINGRSLSDRSVYPSSTFTGTKLFAYAEGGTSIADPVLGFSLRYLNIANVGDILFENHLFTDTFIYVRDSVSQEESISQGFVRQYIDRVSFSSLLGWQTAAQENRSRQVFRFTYSGDPLILDVPIDTSSIYAPLQIFEGSVFIDPTRYTYTVSRDSTVITLTDPPDLGSVIEVQAISNEASEVAYYQVPLNLENNALNENSNAFTLGTIRTHYQSIGQNLRNIQGPIDGANNTRDLGNILRYGDNIVQHSSPLALTGMFLRQKQFEIISSIQFNSREYEKYKALLLDLAAKGNYVNSTPTQILDAVITEISLGRIESSPFYWSDMLPSKQDYTENTYVYSPISTPTFDLLRVYDFTSSNFRGLSVYLNGHILLRDYEYVVSEDAPTLTITVPLAVGDQIAIREYNTTYGSYVPNTPTKMGLYPAFKPEMYLDTTYINPTMVIRGHDGSITVAFEDYRDEVLLEFETRIFNNLKIVSPIPLTADEVIPGQFRTTDYTLQEVNNMLSTDFLSWVGWNKLDYAAQTYLANNEFTYNYSQSENKLNRQPLLGAWRGIYEYFYDTTAPNERPWEMLGFSQEPTWWADYYGPAPYTAGNLVLWDDLANGLVRDPAGEYVIPRYRRPDLTAVIPSDSEGQLLSPLESVVGNFDSTSFRRSWAVGDDGPVENTWKTSSAWPFAVMRLLVLTKPAKFFGLFADRDRYVYDDGVGQFLWDERYRLDAKQINPLYGDGVSKASYINWLIDYNRQLGRASTVDLENSLQNIGVRLCWRVGAFTDKRYLKIFTDRSTPNSLNTSLLLPEESYQILLYKNQPFEQITYSSVIIQSTETGWQVFGYNVARPYFNILASIPNGNLFTLTANGTTARVPLDHSDDVVQVPYGYTFSNVNAVCDFLYSYGQLLARQGFVFETQENGYIIDWKQMAEEFLYWSGQGWSTGAIINLNPAAISISVTRPGAVVESLAEPRPENLIINQNRQPVKDGTVVIERLDNTFRATSLTSDTINFLNLSFTSYENIVILDNLSVFADLIYEPVTGSRQSRVLVSGSISGDWNGTINAPGFVINEDNILEWRPNQGYTKGEIVLFKNEYWVSSTIIQPSTEFNYNLWIRSDYDQVQKGLLPNSSNASDQLAQAYSVYDASLQTDVDLFSFGLIGFRPRQYMRDLNLDDISQVNLYQQFLGSKGTIGALEIFQFADLRKEIAQYDVYEYWAMQRANYGATANRNYFELLLDQSKLLSDPSIIQVINSQEVSDADQTVLVQNVWKASIPPTSPNILPTTVDSFESVTYPTAGYVSLDDVDFTVFDLSRLGTPLENVDLDNLGIGSTVWVAKSNAYDWNVYRVQEVPAQVISVSDNLDGRSLVTFDTQHGLERGDKLIIRYFDPLIDGTYEIISAPSIYTVLINFQFAGTQTDAVGRGVAYTLQSARVTQPSDVNNLPYADLLTAGSRVWVDNDGTGHWAVLEKTQPFSVAYDREPVEPLENSGFGSAISQGFENLAAMIGAPQGGTTGLVYTYVKDSSDAYSQNITLDLVGTTGAAGFGNSIDMGDQTWAIVGASRSLSNQGYAVTVFNPVSSNSFVKTQLLCVAPGDLVTAADRFGYSVTMSRDERWLYIGAPGANKVYCFGRVDVQDQIVRYVGDADTTTFNYSNYISVFSSEQLQVLVDGVVQVLGTDYTVALGAVTFVTAPAEGLPINILRKQVIDQVAGVSYVADGIEDDYVFTSSVDITSDGQIQVKVNGILQTITTDYTVTRTDNVATVTFVSTPSSGDDIDIIQIGYDLATLHTVDDIYSFSVYVGEKIARPFYDYTFAGDTLTFVTVPAVDVSVQIRSATYWKKVAEIDSPEAGAVEFGHSVSTTTDGTGVLIGAPRVSGSTGIDEGRVYYYSRSTQRFQVTDSATTSYSTQQNLTNAPITVLLNGQRLLPTENNVGGQYTISLPTTVTLNVALQVGDIIEVETNYFQLTQTVAANQPGREHHFGYTVDQCVNNCSLFASQPFATITQSQEGSVDFVLNQSRYYGTITSTVANPSISSSGEYIRINNYWVESTGTTIADLVDDINAAGLPNVQASSTPDIEYIADGITKSFAVGDLWSQAASYTPRVLVDDVVQTLNVDYTYDATDQTVDFVIAPLTESVIKMISGRIIIAVKNINATIPLNRLTVLPGSGTLFDDLGLEVYAYVQTLRSPVPQSYAHFGKSLFISDSTVDLVVGAPDASAISVTTFDAGTTYFDSRSTGFADIVPQSGAVYTYDLLPAASPSVANHGKFVFGQQLYDSEISSLDQFGTAVDYTTGLLLVGSPGEDDGDSGANYGRFAEFRNIGRQPAWREIRRQQPVANYELLNTVFMYDRVAGDVKQYFDFFNPLQGRLLGAVRQNLDYIGAIDPAAYNAGDINNYGQKWGFERVGQIWWDTTEARFIDPNQDDIVYASRRWGQLFPGSSVDVYQWISSDVPPSQYQGPGQVRDPNSYAVISTLTPQGLFAATYFFWVTGLRTVDRKAKKTLSIETLARYIESPRSSGIAYVAPLNASTVAIYNALPYISSQDTVLHIEYDLEANEDAIHTEYQLIAQGRADGFLTAGLYRKLQDSFCGVDTVGNLVPDPFLKPSESYGVQFRPRQSMFVNRFLALQNYLVRANTVMSQYPIAESRRFNLLRSQEPEPPVSSGAWNKRVANLEELGFQNLAIVPDGYLYLVVSDSSNNGLWTIYEVQEDALGAKSLFLSRVQTYDTNLYWEFVDWYLPGYDPFTVIYQEVPTVSALDTISVPEGSSVKITANAQGKFEIYRRDGDTWTRVCLQSGTIQIKESIWNYQANSARFGFDIEVFDAQYFDQEPVQETRKIIQSLNEEIFIDDLAIERNNLLILMFNFILQEQQAPLWLTKTSLIDVDHVIRELEPFQVYRRDNQDFVERYIQEVKPYHTQIREFNLIYKGQDEYQGSATDFDLPAYWDAAQGIFVSPVLDNSNPPTLSTTSSLPSTAAVWQTFPYNQWYQNYLQQLSSVTVVDGGSGYTLAPEVVVTGDAEIEATLVARINSAGQVAAIDVVDPGQGYLTTPVITLIGGNGSGAIAVPVMGNSLIRNINTTIKYDRYQYETTITDWQPNVNYDNGDRVRFDNRVWQATSDDSTGVLGPTFELDQWTLVDAATLSGVDRTMGLYVPSVNEPGLDLSQLISGVTYPGVQVTAPDFNQNTGFDVGNFDINPFDNISFGPEGRPSYDPAILDAIYESNFADPYLGTLPAPAYDGDPPDTGPNPIVVNGGEFVDVFSSHAPEELVPGAIFDTLDLRVYTTAGADWTGNGHGFNIKGVSYDYLTTQPAYSFAGLMEFPTQIRVWNQTINVELTIGEQFTIDWINQTVSITNGISAGQALRIRTYGLGGGNQIFREDYNGSDIGSQVVIPVEFDLIDQIAVFVNGELTTDYTYSVDATYSTKLVFSTPLTSSQYVFVVVFGLEQSQAVSWSTPVKQIEIADGSTLSFTLDNNMSGTNPANLIVTKNGVRARPAEGIEYIADGSSLQYYLPARGGYNLNLVADNEVSVYINNQSLILGVDFVVDTAISATDRTITLAELPAPGTRILISVSTAADYYISSGNTLIWRATSSLIPLLGDVIQIISFNDTYQQDIVTEVFVGPTTRGVAVTVDYDTTLYDQGAPFAVSTFDESVGTVIQTNRFDTGRDISGANGERIEVYFNGLRYFEDVNYVIEGTEVIILGAPIGATDVVAITLYTNSVIPGEIAFRIFQDMRGYQTTYRILKSETTTLAQSLSSTADTIYVVSAAALSQPNLPEGIFGVITIDGERITYRNIDYVNNTVSGLRRGTAGTAADSHAVGALVYDTNLGEILPEQYQDRVVVTNTLANGTATVFVTEDLDLSSLTSEEIDRAVMVYVGGTYQEGGYTVSNASPVTVTFTTAPASGYQVSIRVRQGLSWYQPGISTPSDGVALQETDTVAARFIRGQ